MNDELAERWKQFQEESASDNADWVRTVVHLLEEMLPTMVDFDGAGETMNAFCRSAGVELAADSEEGYAFGDAEELPIEQIQRIPLYKNYSALRAFAFYGLPAPAHWVGRMEPEDYEEGPCWAVGKTVETRELDIVGLLENFREYSAFPSDWVGKGEFSQMLEVAEARLRIDSNQGTVSQKGLAGLAGISLKSLKNDLLPSSSSGLRTNDAGEIIASDAIRWLTGRRKYRPSVWQLDLRSREGSKPPPRKSESLSGVVFVPVTKDGDFFRSELRRDGKFFVGPVGDEKGFESYADALRALCEMRLPTWRRPDARKRWRATVGVSWQRMTLEELELSEGGQS